MTPVQQQIGFRVSMREWFRKILTPSLSLGERVMLCRGLSKFQSVSLYPVRGHWIVLRGGYRSKTPARVESAVAAALCRRTTHLLLPFSGCMAVSGRWVESILTASQSYIFVIIPKVSCH